MKKLVAVILTFLFILVGCSKVKVTKVEDDIKTDAIRFHDEYKKVDKDNIFEYETYYNITEILKEKTGIIYLGFPGCDLCEEITPVLDEVAKEKNINKISYYNFKDIRENNTKEYQELIKILSEYTLEDESKIEQIIAPLVIFVRKGYIVGVYKGEILGNSEDIMTEEHINNLKQNFLSLIDKMLIEEIEEDINAEINEEPIEEVK